MTRLTWIVSLILIPCASVAGQTNLPAGTRLRVQIQTPVDTKTSKVGDAVEAVLTEPVQNGNSILLPVGTRLDGRVTAVSPESKSNQTHALLQLSFTELFLPDGQHIETQAVMQSLGLNEGVDNTGTATIHPLSHDFALKSGRKLWLRINTNQPISPLALIASNPSQAAEEVPQSRPRDTPKTSAHLGDLLIALHEMENPAAHPRYGKRDDRHEVLITGIVKNVGKNPVCTSIHAKLETSFKLEESASITLAGRDWGIITELLPSEQLDATFTASVKNGTDPLRLKVSQLQPEQGCGNNSHRLFDTDVSIPVTGLQEKQRAEGEGRER